MRHTKNICFSYLCNVTLEFGQAKVLVGKSPMTRVKYILKGIKRCEAKHGSERTERLPITPCIMQKIKGVC